MICRKLSRHFVFSCVLSVLLAASARAADVSGVSFASSPSTSWRCGLSNADLPGLSAEHMLQPIAAACEHGEAKAYAVVVDLSDSRSAMHAEQMAADAEDQLPSSWRVDSRSYDVITLAGGRLAAYSRLVGKGNGFTFLSGQTPMVAISANVPLLFEDESGAVRQTIAVFRVRSPLPAAASERKARIGELDRMLREWAGTAQPARGRTISDRDFELAAYARTKGTPAAVSTASAPAPVSTEKERISAAIAAVANKRATSADLDILEDATKRFSQTALGETARSYLEDARRLAQQSAQEQILLAAMDSVKEGAGDLFSRFILASLKNRDAAGMVSALRIAKQRGWTVGITSPAAAGVITTAILEHTLPIAPGAEDRAFFELPSAEILRLVQSAKGVARIEDVARPARSEWRIKDGSANASYIVQYDKAIGILQRQGTTYQFRPITNLLDLSTR
jgi:hypothetical protein